MWDMLISAIQIAKPFCAWLRLMRNDDLVAGNPQLCPQLFAPLCHIVDDLLETGLVSTEKARLGILVNPNREERNPLDRFVFDHALGHERISAIALGIISNSGQMLSKAVFRARAGVEGTGRRFLVMRRLLGEVPEAEENRLAFVDLDSLDEIHPGIDRPVTHRKLIVG